ncbi:MAG: CAP domain-containing protein [Chloroflexota bacterium]
MKRLLVCAFLCLALLAPQVALAASADYDVPGGHFFTQAAGDDGSAGFDVLDDGDARFWSEFQRLGGVQGVGYPVSQRFKWDGFVVQVMQKGVFQWRPEVGRVYFVNVFDQLSLSGKDDWLTTVRSTPKMLGPDFDAGKSWGEVVAARQGLLDANPAIKKAYYAASDPLNLYGLPTSKVVDNGNHYAVRLQRAVIQQWKVKVPWAEAGQVTIANGGDVGKEAGLFPATALKPIPMNQPITPPSTRGGTRPTAPATGSTQQIALDLVNAYRAQAGARPLTLSDALNRATGSHASYYVQNYGDPALAGLGLHKETPGKPGFTGTDILARAFAAGYTDFFGVDENVGLVGDARKMIDWAMGTVSHRWNLLHPSAVHLGYGIGTEHKVDVMNIGMADLKPGAVPPSAFPGDGQRDVPVSSYIYETPDPAPGVPRPLGFPITLSYGVNDTVKYATWTLTGADGQPLQVYTSQRDWLRSLAIIPAKPLHAGETYTVRVTGTLNGQPFTKTWSFTTAK